MRNAFLASGLASGLALLTSSAIAAPYFTDDTTPGNPNVIFNACTAPDEGPGTTLYGCLNTDHDKRVKLDSSQVVEGNGGQAEIDAPGAPDNNGLFSDLTISFEDGTLFDMVGFAVKLGSRTASGIASIEGMLDSTGVFAPIPPQSPGDEIMSGNNQGEYKFSVFSNSGTDYFSAVRFTFNSNLSSADQVEAIRQIRFGNLFDDNQIPVPEPASMALFGAGLAALGLSLRRRPKDA